MKNIKSHFWLHKHQRNGIFFLLMIILFLQGAFWFGDFSRKDNTGEITAKELLLVREKLDSFRSVAPQIKKYVIRPFNPNYISDFKGYKLGLSMSELERLRAFRNTGKFINSVTDFKKVTKVSDSVLLQIAPYFKFPDWVVERNRRRVEKQAKSNVESSRGTPRKPTSSEVLDLNTISVLDFSNSIGLPWEVSERIIEYREALQGFTFMDQVLEVKDLSKRQGDLVLQYTKILKKPKIEKLNINEASFKEVLKIPYINYDLCEKIFAYKEEVAEIQNMEELKNISNFPLKKYDRIVLYLKAE